MLLAHLPPEILYLIVTQLDQLQDVRYVVCTNRYFYMMFIEYLFEFDIAYRGCRAMLWAVKGFSNEAERKSKMSTAKIALRVLCRSPLTYTVNQLRAKLTPLAVEEGNHEVLGLLVDNRFATAISMTKAFLMAVENGHA